MAMEILRRFNLILILEFVDDEMWALEEALGWTQARKQVCALYMTRRVRGRQVATGSIVVTLTRYIYDASNTAHDYPFSPH